MNQYIEQIIFSPKLAIDMRKLVNPDPALVADIQKLLDMASTGTTLSPGQFADISIVYDRIEEQMKAKSHCIDAITDELMASVIAALSAAHSSKPCESSISSASSIGRTLPSRDRDLLSESMAASIGTVSPFKADFIGQAMQLKLKNEEPIQGSRLAQAAAAPRITPCESFISSASSYVSSYGFWAVSGVAAAAGLAYTYFSSNNANP